MKIIKNLFLFMILGYQCSIYTINGKIILFLNQYPGVTIKKLEPSMEALSKKLQQPNYLLKHQQKNTIVGRSAQGAACLHLGYTDISNEDGQITFPRTYQRPVINLLVTEGIQPVYIIAPATIHNWMLDKNKPSQMYQFKFTKDQETNLFYIETSKIPLPENLMIPLETIIIFSDPKNVFVPIGATIAQYSPNLIVPQIYLKKNFDYAYNALYTLSIKHYFDRVHSEYKPEEQTIARLIR